MDQARRSRGEDEWAPAERVQCIQSQFGSESFSIETSDGMEEGPSSLTDVLSTANDREKRDDGPDMGCCRRLLKYGVMGKPATGIRLLFVCMTLSIIPRGILAPVTPSIIKSGFGRDMCPNITAAHRTEVPVPGVVGHGTEGFRVQAEKESASGFTSAFAAPVAGYLSDKIGRRPVLILSAIGLAVPLSALALTCDTAYYVPLIVFCGAPFDTAYSTALFAYIADVVPSGQRGEAYGFIMITFTVAQLIAAPIGGYLAESWSETHSRLLFEVCAVASLLPVIFTILFIAEPSRMPPAPTVLGERRTKKGYAGLRPLLLGPLGAYLLVNFLISMESAGVGSLFMLYITDAFPECGPECQSTQTIAFAICNAISNGILLPLCLRTIGSTTTLWLSMVANFMHCVIFALAQQLWVVYSNFVFSGLALLGYSVMSDFISDSVPPELVGSAVGASNSLYMLASVLSPILHAYLFIQWADNPLSREWPGLPWLTGAGFVLLALLAMFATRAVRRRPGAEDKKLPLLVEGDDGEGMDAA